MSDGPWIDADWYRELRSRMELSSDHWADQLEWQQAAKFPDSADIMAQQLIWVILNSGMKNEIAALIADRIAVAWAAGKPTSSAFRHEGKISAINYIWENRARLWQEARLLKDADLVEWCGRLPWIGKITKYHAAKNLGADVPKPDRWLERIAVKSGETVGDLCARLSFATGDRIATVDLVLWWACAHGPLAAELGVKP